MLLPLLVREDEGRFFLVSAATRSLLCRNSGFGSHITQQSVEPPTVVAFLIPRVVYHQHIPI